MTQFWLTTVPNDPALPPNDVTGGDIGAGPDFWNLMEDPSEWRGIAGDLSVLQIYSGMVSYVPERQQVAFYSWAARHDIPLAFNSGVLTYDDPFLPEISTFLACGGSLPYIDMDEPYYIAGYEAGSPMWSAAQVAANAASVLDQVIPLAPDVKIIDEEPIPVLTSAELASWCLAYQVAMGRPLDGMQLDVDWNYGAAIWKPALISAVATLEAVGVPPGIIIDAYASTNMGWCDEAIDNYITCRTMFGDTIAVYDFQTWMPNPTDLLSDTNPASLTNVEYAAQFYDPVSAAYRSILGRLPSQGELFAAMRAVSSRILTMPQLEANLRRFGEGVPESALYDGASGTATFLPGRAAAVALTSNDQTVVAGSRLTVITCPIADVADDILGYSPARTKVVLTGPGTVYPATYNTYLSPPGQLQLGYLTDDVTFVLSSHETIIVGPSLDIGAVAAGQDDTISMTWQGAPAEILAAGNATTVLDLACSGMVEPGCAIAGIGTLALSQAVPGSPFLFVANSDRNATLIDVAGGDTIAVANATQTVINEGAAAATVRVAAAAGATVIGEAGGVTLEVTTAGTFTLGAADANLTVAVPAFSQATLNAMPFITADATAGHASITVGSSGQTIWAGASDVITDPSGLGYTLNGSHAQLTGDVIVGFNPADIIDITDFSPPCTCVSTTVAGDSRFVHLDQGANSLVLDFVGVANVARINLASDGNGGTFVRD